MRFAPLEGNPTAVIDRAEGVVYHLQSPLEAASLSELLNTMHMRIISLETSLSARSGDNFSERKVLPAGAEGEEQI